MLTPHPPLSSAIVDWFRQELAVGHLGPGSRLPSERLIGEQFGVSRSVVREAMSELKSEGLVMSRQGKGVFVTERGSRRSFQLAPHTLEDTASLNHVIELIATIESSAARLAALRRDDDDLKAMRRALVGMEYAIVHDLPGDEEDYAFHQAVVDATHNPQFVSLNEYLEQHARRLIRRARHNTLTRHQSLVAQVQREHQDIFQAIEAGNPDAAAEAAENHLRNAARRLDVYLGKPLETTHPMTNQNDAAPA